MKIIAVLLLLFFGSVAPLFGAVTNTEQMFVIHEEHEVLLMSAVILCMFVLLVFTLVTRKFNWPFVVIELCAGLFLGLVLKSIFPSVHEWLFQTQEPQRVIFEAIGKLGVYFLLFHAGLELKPSQAFKRARPALSIGIIGVLIPLVLGYFLTISFVRVTGYHLNSSAHIFALFVSITMSISAMVIIIRIFSERGYMQTHFGQVVICGYAVNDVLAFILFAVVFQAATSGEVHLLNSVAVLVCTGLATFASLRFLPSVMDKVFRRLAEHSEYCVMMGMVIFAALGGVTTHYFGLSSLYGVFIAGIVLSESKAVSGKCVDALTGFPRTIMVPLYFVGLGVMIDLQASFNLSLIVFMTVCSIALKWLGAYVGAIFGGRHRKERNAIGVSFTPSGVTGIILCGLALEAGVIGEDVVLATVISALVSSILAAPWLDRVVEGVVDKTFKLKPSVCRRHGLSVSHIAVPKISGSEEPNQIREEREAAKLELVSTVATYLAARGDVTDSDRTIRDAFLKRLGEAVTGESTPKENILYIHARDIETTRPRVLFGWLSHQLAWDEDNNVRFVMAIIVPKHFRDAMALQLKVAKVGHAIHSRQRELWHESASGLSAVVEQIIDELDAPPPLEA